MALVKWKNRELQDPWADFKTLQDEINQLFNIDRYPAARGIFDRSLSPAMDVIEDQEGYTIHMELPGVDQKDLEITMASQVLTIKGEKGGNKEEKKGKSFRKESWSGSFQRTLPLPNSVDPDKIKADLSKGILTITVPKREEARPKQISVKVQ